jgi:hypothetical protein
VVVARQSYCHASQAPRFELPRKLTDNIETTGSRGSFETPGERGFDLVGTHGRACALCMLLRDVS